MFGLEKAANWWDGQRKDTEDILQEWVNDSDSSFAMHSKAVTAALVSTSMALGAGLVDVLRLGEGVKEGGWGYAQDGLRLLSFAGPVVRLGRLGLAKWTVDPMPNEGICAMVAIAKAMRQTGNRFFLRAEEVIGKMVEIPGDLSLIVNKLKYFFGARTTLVPYIYSGPERLGQILTNHPKSVVLFNISWKWKVRGFEEEVAHMMYAFKDSLGRVKIADRSGKIVSSLKELDSLYPNISSGTLYGNAVVVHNAIIVEGASFFSMLAIEVTGWFKSTVYGNEITFTAVKD
jgi:hypothetical protein